MVVVFLGVQIGDLVLLGVFLGKSEVFKVSGIFRGNPFQYVYKL